MVSPSAGARWLTRFGLAVSLCDRNLYRCCWSPPGARLSSGWVSFMSVEIIWPNAVHDRINSALNELDRFYTASATKHPTVCGHGRDEFVLPRDEAERRVTELRCLLERLSAPVTSESLTKIVWWAIDAVLFESVAYLAKLRNLDSALFDGINDIIATPDHSSSYYQLVECLRICHEVASDRDWAVQAGKLGLPVNIGALLATAARTRFAVDPALVADPGVFIASFIESCPRPGEIEAGMREVGMISDNGSLRGLSVSAPPHEKEDGASEGYIQVIRELDRILGKNNPKAYGATVFRHAGVKYMKDNNEFRAGLAHDPGDQRPDPRGDFEDEVINCVDEPLFALLTEYANRFRDEIVDNESGKIAAVVFNAKPADLKRAAELVARLEWDGTFRRDVEGADALVRLLWGLLHLADPTAYPLRALVEDRFGKRVEVSAVTQDREWMKRISRFVAVIAEHRSPWKRDVAQAS